LLKSVEDINATKKRLRIEIPSDVLEREIKASLEKVRQNARIPGFRPGKAPISLIEKRFGKEIEAEVLDRVVPEHLTSAIREADVNPVTMPALDEEFHFERNNPINLSVTVEVMPKIEKLNYENISVKDIQFTVGETDIDETLKRLQNQKAVFEVTDKVAETDDLVTFDYVDSEVAGGETDPSVKELVSKMGNEIFPPDLMEEVIGKKKDDIVEFTTTLDESKSKELAGKTVNVKVRINEVKKKNLPEIDDEFAKDLGLGNLSELREKLREKITDAKKEHLKKIQKAEILKKLVDLNSVEVPEILLNRELESISLEKSLSAADREEDSGSPEIPPDVLEAVPGTDSGEKSAEEERADKLREKALMNVRASIIVDAIGEKEGVVVTDSEVDERIALMAKRLSATPEAIRNFYMYKQGSLDGVKHSIYEEKVMDLLLSRATIVKEENT
jgi:trigger factor